LAPCATATPSTANATATRKTAETRKRRIPHDVDQSTVSLVPNFVQWCAPNGCSESWNGAAGEREIQRSAEQTVATKPLCVPIVIASVGQNRYLCSGFVDRFLRTPRPACDQANMRLSATAVLVALAAAQVSDR